MGREENQMEIEADSKGGADKGWEGKSGAGEIMGR